MCGIAGSVSLSPSQQVDPCVLRRMTAILRHRGPDDEGTWTDGQVGLGSRRLAVIDLSPRGHQPMSNEDESLTIVFNGEVYNFGQLRDQLLERGHRFKSSTDTEVILHLYEQEGAACLQRLRGMFAFAVWDARDHSLFIARDRLGKKPLFYYHGNGWFVFGSEPKALLQHPVVRAEADPRAIHHFLSFGYVPSPWSAFAGMRKLPPAHYLVLRDGDVTLRRYWDLHYFPKRRETEAALTEETAAQLEEAVRLRMISDVPLGALLSGGIDSATVVALMRRLTSGPIKTFSIGFDDAEFNELQYARQVAARFDTDHHEEIVRPDAAALLPRIVWHYSEPFGDSSAVPSFIVSQVARRHVTVALNGDGGDESFLGYERYFASGVTGPVDRVPRQIRAWLSRGAAVLPAGSPKSRSSRMKRLLDALDRDPWEQYAGWVTYFDRAAKADLYTPEFASEVASSDSLGILLEAFARTDASTRSEASAHADIQLYLPDDLLVKMDIASMANSLEARSPFLDHEVVEFAAALPRRMKLHGLTLKYVIKRAMRGVLPEQVLRRRKMGFGVPIHRWLREDLRELAYDVLLDKRAVERGILRQSAVRRYLDEHSTGRAQHDGRLWCLLMLELWHRMFIDGPIPATPPLTSHEQ